MTENKIRLRLEALHREVDAQVAEVTTALIQPLTCRRGCADCCVDELTVFGVEADLIRHHHADFLATAEPHSAGSCAFLQADGACRIYAQRPYVCRTQGLPLRWQDVGEGGETVELRDICPLNEEPLFEANDLDQTHPVRTLQTLDPAQCWELGIFEGRLASLQAEAQGTFDLSRVALRELFGAQNGS